MEYQVPQFIEVEDKVIGPFSFKQFVFIAGGAGLCVIIFLYLPFMFAVLLDLPIAALTFALAFYKINNKSFIDILEAGFNFYTKDRLFLWRKESKEQKSTPIAPQVQPPQREKLGLTSGKLKELAWSLDIQDTQPPK
jgi:PrgI family protein